MTVTCISRYGMPLYLKFFILDMNPTWWPAGRPRFSLLVESSSNNALGRIRISEEFRVSGFGSGSVGSVDLISGSGFVVSGYPGFGYPSRYSIIRGYPDPDPDPSK
ncbi:hypothetical protein F2Q68_00029934 [Brassica cretica]|uniref:Uncharacterized protein n=1 Tax=Brassica cretica TaxID=69181 RepID=A0A8S9G8T4_BRACR|nr:hypothetical protein F2Q68_00029934 [Brassica cretica]